MCFAKIMLQQILLLFNTKKFSFPSTFTGHMWTSFLEQSVFVGSEGAVGRATWLHSELGKRSCARTVLVISDHIFPSETRSGIYTADLSDPLWNLSYCLAELSTPVGLHGVLMLVEISLTRDRVTS
jgi:hypothetical protein